MAINKKYGISDTIVRRYRAFAREYCQNGFNATQAYIKAYKIKDAEDKGKQPYFTAKSDSNQLLTNLYFNKILVEELKKAGMGEYLTKEWIVNKSRELFDSAKKEATKGRMLELLSRIGDLYRDNTSQVSIFQGLETKEKDIVNRRLDKADKAITEPVKAIVGKDE